MDAVAKAVQRKRGKGMINLRITDKREDIREWTGLPSDNFDEALWNAGFNLDDWDMCIESDTRLIREVDAGTGEKWEEPIDEAWWLVIQMDNYCFGYNEVEYKGKWYYTVHHA